MANEVDEKQCGGNAEIENEIELDEQSSKQCGGTAELFFRSLPSEAGDEIELDEQTSGDEFELDEQTLGDEFDEPQEIEESMQSVESDVSTSSSCMM